MTTAQLEWPLETLKPAREAFARAVRDAVLSDNPEATALEAVKQLECMNKAQYRGIKRIADLLGVPPKDESISAVTKAVESLLGTVAQLREGNENLKASWDREIVARTKAEAKLAADVPTWRPIEEWDGNTRVTFHDGFDSWCSANPVSATHFIAPPPKPDPFEGWWKEQGHGNKAVARVIWDAAVASTNERDFCVEAKKVWDASREDDLDV